MPDRGRTLAPVSKGILGLVAIILLAQFVALFSELVFLAGVAAVAAPVLGFVLVIYMIRQITVPRPGVSRSTGLPEATSTATIAGLLGYLILACSYAMAYCACATLENPVIQKVCCVDVRETNFWTLLYFSIITGATVGYGDMIPSSGWSRFLTAAEALQFWLFLAWVVVAITKAVDEVKVLLAEVKSGEPAPQSEDALRKAEIWRE